MLVPSRIHISKKENQKLTSTPSKTYNQLEIHKPINQLTPRPPESRPCTTPPRCLCRRPRCQRSGTSPVLPPSAGFAESGGSPIPQRHRGSAPGGGDGKPDLHRPRKLLKGGIPEGWGIHILPKIFHRIHLFGGHWFVLVLLFMVSFYKLHIFHRHL